MFDRVSDPINPLLEEYLLLIEIKLPGFISAFYLDGSIALGAFNERLSDIAFIAFISRGWSEYDLTDLKEIHRTIETTYPIGLYRVVISGERFWPWPIACNWYLLAGW